MRQRRMLAAVTAVLAFLVAAALFPLQWFGQGAVDFFPEGNPVGSLGDTVNARLLAALGIGIAAVPLGILAAAGSVGEWWKPARRKSLWVVAAALLVLLPVSAFLAGAGDTASGFLGRVLGAPLRDTVGWLGGWVVVGSLAVAAWVAAFTFNPLAAPGRLATRVFHGAGRGMRATGEAVGRWGVRHRDRLAAKRQAQASRASAEEPAAATSADGPAQDSVTTETDPAAASPDPIPDAPTT
ncbi:MAG: hypothetical protein F4022_04795, partial [Gemmatimonadetes bacterium]|nr:hypothetical protein [Gemmatimonadota bacterium]